jgi:hypothetical protein
MANFNLSEYETVDTRIHRLYSIYPNARIITNMVEMRSNELGQIVQYVFKAEIYRDIADPVPSATGYAEEIIGSNYINKTSACEVCETSAIGRGLANLGLSPKASRPSVEEMGKADRVQKTAPKKTLTQAIEEATPIVEKAKQMESLKEEAYAKAKSLKIHAAAADQFLTRFAGVDAYSKIDWYTISLEPRSAWQKAADEWRAKG